MRQLSRILLLCGLFMVVFAAPADALTVVPPAPVGTALHPGDEVHISGPDKVAGTTLKIWGNDAYQFCDGLPDASVSGSWSCTLNGPFGPGTYSYEVRVFDSSDNQVGAGVPFGFTVVSRLRVDVSSLRPTSGKRLTVTGQADGGEEVDAVLTSVMDSSLRLSLACSVNDDLNTFSCTDTSGRSGRRSRPASLPVGAYLLNLSEIDSELGEIAAVQQEITMGPPVVVPPTHTATPTPTPTPTPTHAPSPTSAPTPTTTATPSATLSPIPTAAPSETPAPPVADPQLVSPATPLRPHSPVPDLSVLIGLLIVGFVMITSSGGVAFSSLRLLPGRPGAAGTGVPPGLETPPVVTHSGSDDEDLDLDTDHRSELGWGDRSWTWRLPGHSVADRLGLKDSRTIAPRSPLVGRLLADAGYLRSMLGIAWVVPTIVAAVLAGFALADVHGRPLPPAVGLIVAIIVLACVDAIAGAVASGIFWLGVIVSGGLGDAAKPGVAGSLGVLLVLGLLWTGLPLIGSAARPFRRGWTGRRLQVAENHYSWDRLADAFIAAALCAWIADKLTAALPPFTGLDLQIGQHALAVGIATGAGVALRILLEEVAEHGYPKRLHEVETPGGLPHPSTVVEVSGALFRTGLVALIAYVFLHDCWQLWVGAALVGIIEVGTVFKDRLPQSQQLGRLLPRGITKILVMLIVCTVVAKLAATKPVDLAELRASFVIMAVPSFLVSVTGLFAKNVKPLPWRWRRQLAGAAVYVAIVLIVIYGW
ncbi:MAG TPA: hypothetical protein VFE15_07665 [Marmoricola sp.]|jgi:hypothetical protein|nr:hypothetical protein [Marmoricola sp.]